MQLPSLKKFFDIRDRSELLGPSKVPEMSVEEMGSKEVYMSWEKTLTPTDKTIISKRFIRPTIIIGIFVGVLLLIMQQFILMIAIGSFIFFLQALKKMVPENVRYEISNHGVMIGDEMYYWSKLRRFFYITVEGSEVLAIDTILGFPGRVYVHFDEKDKEKIKEILNRYLHYLENEPRTFMDDTYDRIMKKFNLEEDSILAARSEPTEKKEEADKESLNEEA